MCLDDLQVFAFLYALRTYSMVRDDTGWVPRNARKSRKRGNAIRTYMCMFRGLFVLEREDDQFSFRPPAPRHHSSECRHLPPRGRAEYHLRTLPGLRTSLPTRRTYRRGLAPG